MSDTFGSLNSGMNSVELSIAEVRGSMEEIGNLSQEIRGEVRAFELTILKPIRVIKEIIELV